MTDLLTCNPPTPRRRRQLTHFEEAAFQAAVRIGHLDVRGPSGTRWRAQTETRERARLLGLFGARAAGLITPGWFFDLVRLDGLLARQACKQQLSPSYEGICVCGRGHGRNQRGQHAANCIYSLPEPVPPGFEVLAHSVTEGFASDNWIASLPDDGRITVRVRRTDGRWYCTCLRSTDGVPYKLLAVLHDWVEADSLAAIAVWGDYLGERGIGVPGPDAWRVVGGAR